MDRAQLHVTRARTTETSTIVVVSTLPRSHARRSGYPLLAEYLAKDAWITALRSDPDRFLPWFLARVASRFAFSRWYVGGSAIAEWNCRRFLRGRAKSIVHMLWADNDLGFLDHYLCFAATGCAEPSIIVRTRWAQQSAFPIDFAALRPSSSSAKRSGNSCWMPAWHRSGFMSCFMGSIRDISPLPINPPCLPGQFSRSVGTDVISVPCEMSAMVLADNPDIHFRVIAPTSAKPLFNRLANVTFESGLSDDGLVKAYRESSCFLTMVENATATNALLEAMACGLPVIAERIGGIPEYVNEKSARP